jgi:dUTP pyrophosphatase
MLTISPSMFFSRANLSLSQGFSACFNESMIFSSFPTFALMGIPAFNIINQSNNPLPEYATAGSSGMDIRAFISAPIVLMPMQRALVPTGLFVELTEGFEIQVRPRSGLAIKQGITCVNSPGTIDADYRGEIKVLLVNLSSDVFTIDPGERIAQMVIAKHEQIEWLEQSSLSESERGEGGFGSTGVK